MIRDCHSALADVQLLQRVFGNQHVHGQHMYTFERLMFDLKQKLPIPIMKVYEWARRCRSHQDLETMLIQFVKKKTALSSNQMLKIAFGYSKDRYIICK